MKQEGQKATSTVKGRATITAGDMLTVVGPCAPCIHHTGSIANSPYPASCAASPACRCLYLSNPGACTTRGSSTFLPSAADAAASSGCMAACCCVLGWLVVPYTSDSAVASSNTCGCVCRCGCGCGCVAAARCGGFRQQSFCQSICLHACNINTNGVERRISVLQQQHHVHGLAFLCIAEPALHTQQGTTVCLCAARHHLAGQQPL